jgi:hypothetical protein
MDVGEVDRHLDCFQKRMHQLIVAELHCLQRNMPIIREATHDDERYSDKEDSAADECGGNDGDNKARRLSVAWLVIRHCCLRIRSG